jgi:two-component system, NarL family, sensor histidine kinase UhpB
VHLSLLTRVFLANATVLAIIALLLLFSPIEIDFPVTEGQAVIIIAGFVVSVTVNLVVLRRLVSPLRRLTTTMRSVEPLEPGRRLVVVHADAEVEALSTAFNEMLGRLERERRESGRRALAAQEQERQRVARELHDEVGQGLIAITLMAERAASESPPDVAEQFTAIADKLLFYLDELRRIAHELRPETLDDLGLVNALNALCNGVGADRGVVVDRDLYGRFDGLSGEQELVLYRVAQEALANAARHADASRVSLRLAERRSELTLEVLDDGRGVAPTSGDGVGIKGMRERARLVGGSFEIGPNPGSGTRVKLVVPLEQAG